MSSQRSASLFRFRGTPFLVVMPRPGVHKKHLKAKPPAGQRDPYNTLSDEEVRLARLWLKEDDMEPSEIAALLRRDKSTMTRLLVMEKDAVRGARLALETLCPLIAPPGRPRWRPSCVREHWLPYWRGSSADTLLPAPGRRPGTPQEPCR